MEGIVLIGILLALAWQDARNRTVSLYLLAALAVFSIVFVAIGNGNLKITLLNMGLTSILLGAIVLYFKLKYGIKKGVIDQQLGVGDVLMLFLLTPYFSPINFLAFINLSCLLALSIELLRIKRNPAIPLITYFSMAYMLLFMMHALRFKPAYFFQNNWLWTQ